METHDAVVLEGSAAEEGHAEAPSGMEAVGLDVVEAWGGSPEQAAAELEARLPAGDGQPDCPGGSAGMGAPETDGGAGLVVQLAAELEACLPGGDAHGVVRAGSEALGVGLASDAEVGLGDAEAMGPPGDA